jgi:uncharacterized protein YbjT (DUF2867 family)
MTILLTGAAGLAGREILEALGATRRKVRAIFII